MTQHQDTDAFSELPLSDRLPEYLAIFGSGLGGAVVLALLITLLGPRFLTSLTNLLIAMAVFLWIGGGVQGGGYSNLGIGTMGQLARRPENRQTLDERLQQGLRPGRNPRAFWQVVCGLIYLAIAIGIMSLGA